MAMYSTDSISDDSWLPNYTETMLVKKCPIKHYPLMLHFRIDGICVRFFIKTNTCTLWCLFDQLFFSGIIVSLTVENDTLCVCVCV